MDLFVICFLCLSYCLVCSVKPCCHLLGKGCPFGSLACNVFVIVPSGVMGQVWYLIVSIPDLCILPYFQS